MQTAVSFATADGIHDLPPFPFLLDPSSVITISAGLGCSSDRVTQTSSEELGPASCPRRALVAAIVYSHYH